MDQDSAKSRSIIGQYHISIRLQDCVPLIHNVRSCTLTVISCLHLIGVENRLVDRDGSKRRSDGKQKKARGSS